MTAFARPKQLRVVVVSSQETEEARSPLDAPQVRFRICMHAEHVCPALELRLALGSSDLATAQEWEAPMPSRRPDIFPDFERMDQVFLPKPLPGDPEMPDEEFEESVKRTTPGDPDPEHKTGEPPEEPERPAEPGAPEPERKTDIPNAPE